MPLTPFGFLAVSGVGPINLIPPSIARVGTTNTIVYTPGTWDTSDIHDEFSLSYEWYFGMTPTGDTTSSSRDVVTGVAISVVETATNKYDETVISTNTITLVGTTNIINEFVGVTWGMTGSFNTASNTHNGIFIESVGVAWGMTDTSKYQDTYPIIQNGAIVYTQLGQYNDAQPIVQNGTMVYNIFGSYV